MTEDVVGSLELGDFIDITDPCYGEDVWCRINKFPVTAGTYECYAIWANNNETNGWGNRVARIGIRSDKADRYERKGMIGVDSGMAGFFTCDNKKIFEDILAGETDDVYLYDDAFVTSSGYGDGGYDVYAGYKNGNLVEVYIEFIGEKNV